MIVGGPAGALHPVDQTRHDLAQELEALKPVTMSVPPDGEFALNLWTLVQKFRLTKIVETGTYTAVGTTAIIASALDDLLSQGLAKPEDIAFRTIESNWEAVKIARENLRKSGFDLFTFVHEGLTIPRSKLPTPQEIKEWTVDAVKDLPIDVDHPEGDRVFRYYAETSGNDGPDDQLRLVLALYDYKPEMLMLDSGGHIGWQEFSYLMELLEGPCFIAFDDAFHVKHYRTLQFMLDDPRFDLRCIGKERYGYAIAHYQPDAENVNG